MGRLFKDITSLGAAAGGMLLDNAVRKIKYGIESFERQRGLVSFGDLEDVTSDDPNGMSVDGVRSLRPEHPNIVLFGATGGFKSTVAIATQLLRADGPTFVVHNPANTMYPLTAPRLARLGYGIHNFDFSNLLNGCSGLNLIDLVRSDEDASSISNHFFRGKLDGGKADPFFHLSASALVSFLLRLSLRLEPRYRTLANVRHMLDALLSKGLHKVAAKYCTDRMFGEYKSLIGNGSEKTLGSIVLTAQAALDYWANEALCRVTALSTVDLDSLRAKKQVIYLSTSNYDAIYYRSLTSLIVNEAMHALMRQVPREGCRPVHFLIDECDTLSLDNLGKLVSNTRKFSIYNYLIYQNPGQLENNFSRGEAQNIQANSCKLYYGPQDLATSRELAEMMGRLPTRDGSSKGAARYLMDAQEVLKMPRDRGILLCRNRPYRLRLQPWFRQPLLKQRANGPASAFVNSSIPSSVPLISLQ